MNKNFITIKDAKKQYPDGTIALKPINLEVSEGEVLVLLGPSGCGKSTLLRMIAGLEKSSGGSVKVNGKEILDLPPEKRGIGLVFQQYALFPTMTVRENIGFGLKIRKKSKQEIADKVDEMLEMMNLQELKDRKPNQLSGGQQQRVAIARALAIEPSILLLDEPLTALDAQLKEHLRIELALLFRRLKITTIYVTHDQVEAMAIADRIAIMDKGVIEQIGSATEIYRSPSSSFVARFIGQVNQLKGIVRGKNVDFGFYQVPIPLEKKIKEGSSCDAFIRPEDLYISSEGGFSAIVNDVIFLGSRTRILLEAKGNKLILDVPNDTMLVEGSTVKLEIPNTKIIFA